MRGFLLLAASMLSACASAPKPVDSTAADTSSSQSSQPVAPAPMPEPPKPTVAEVKPAPAPEAPAPTANPVPTPPAPSEQAAPAPTRPDAPKPSAAPAPPAAQPAPVVPVKPAPIPPAPAKPAPTAPIPAAPTPTAVATPAPAADSTSTQLSGRITLSGGPGNPVDPRDLADTVVYFVPEGGGGKPQPGRFTMYTQGKAFDPALLVVPQGSTVVFPNNDPIRHNVYSATPGAAFDLGFYGEGESREHVFNQPGLVVVTCNVHHVMQAQVLVVPTRFQTRLDASGRYRLTDLPSGRGTLYFWHPRASLSSQGVSVPVSISIDRKIALSKPRLGR